MMLTLTMMNDDDIVSEFKATIRIGQITVLISRIRPNGIRRSPTEHDSYVDLSTGITEQNDRQKCIDLRADEKTAEEIRVTTDLQQRRSVNQCCLFLLGALLFLDHTPRTKYYSNVT